MPTRVVRGEINSSQSLNRVSSEADLTFRALIVAVDDFGRFDARPGILKATLFPLRAAFTPEKILRWVRELAEEGCVDLYEVDGKPFLALTGWERHRGNTKRGRSSKYPEKQTPGESPEIRGIPGDPLGSRESGVESRESLTVGPRAGARSPAAPAEWAVEAARSLRESVRRRWPGAPVPESLVAWARDIERIKSEPVEIGEALRWLADPARDGDRYVPECRSGRTVREKYAAILAARQRASMPTRQEAQQKPGPSGMAYKPFKPEAPAERADLRAVLGDLRAAIAPR